MSVFSTSFSNWMLHNKTHGPYLVAQKTTWTAFKTYILRLLLKYKIMKIVPRCLKIAI